MSPITSSSSDKLQKIKEKKFVLAKFSLCCYKYVRLKKISYVPFNPNQKNEEQIRKNSIIFFKVNLCERKGLNPSLYDGEMGKFVKMV